MSYTTAETYEPERVVVETLPLDEDAECLLKQAEAVLNRHSLFGKDRNDSNLCPDCVQSNRCTEFNDATAVYQRYGVTPKRVPRSSTVRALREHKRREDAWLAE